MTIPTVPDTTIPLNEEWRPVAGFEGLYEVSSLGRVRSLDAIVRNRHGTRPRRGRVLRETTSTSGYQLVYLSRQSKVTTRGVHRLVAEAFLPNPAAAPEVNHIDFNKANNAASNLEWVTAKDNAQHHARTGRRARALAPDDIRSIRRRLAQGEIPRTIAPDFAVNIGTIYAIKRGHIWAHVK